MSINSIKKTTLLFVIFLSSIKGFCQSYNYEKATEAFKAENYDVALDYYTREINDNPKNNEAYFYRALVYQYKANNSMALTDINAAIKGFDKNEKKWLAACHNVKAKIYLIIEDSSKAINEYSTAIKLNPNYSGYYIYRGDVYYFLQQYENAEKDYNKVIKMDEGDEQALTSLGRNYIAQNNFAEAEKILNQVIKLNPEYASSYYFRAVLFFKQKKYEEAISDAFYSYLIDESDKQCRNLFVQYAEKNIPYGLSKVNAKVNEYPEKDNWYFVRAQLHENNKAFLSAVSDYSKMLEYSDASYRGTILSYRADCYKNEGLYDQAIVDYNEVITLDSNYAYYYAYRGDTKRLKGDFNGALEDFNKAIKIQPDNAWFFYRRGWVKDEFLKDTKGGLEDYSEAIAIDKNYAYAYLHRGRLYREKLKNEKKATADFLALVSLDTTISNNGNCRQYGLFHLDKNAEAIDWLNKILEKYPTDGNYYDAACLYSLMKMSKEAVAHLGLAFENGYRDFTHLFKDDDLDNVRNYPEFIALVSEWKRKYELTKSNNPVEKNVEDKQIYQTATIPMKSKGGGVYEVSCKVNDLKLNFIFDTGAGDISISQTEALFMLKNDYLSEADIKGKESYMDANGDISIGTKIILRKVEIGGIVLKNITASVVNNKVAPLLFGQSALSKYGKIIIDNKKSEITISVPESK